MKTKFVSLLIITVISLSSCKLLKKGGTNSDSRGQITQREDSKNWQPVRPKGMVPVPSGSFVLGQSDYDFTQELNAPLKTVSISSFFIDDSEVTNDKYRQFVEYVRDSIARTMLAERAAQLGFNPLNPSPQGDQGIAAYAYVSGSESGDSTPWDEYVAQQTTGREGGLPVEQSYLNWDVELFWNKYDYPDVDYAEVIDQLYYAPEERFNNERNIDTRKLKFKFYTVDENAAAKAKGRGYRSDFVVPEVVEVYPDTTVWVRDFNYSYNDPMHEYYFWHESYVDYPVVGVTWKQAKAYCAYRTQKHNQYLGKQRRAQNKEVFEYRLPTEVEWEYAARGGLQDAPYPWGGPYLTDDRGLYLANFKPKRGDYIECTDEKNFGYLYTAPVKKFPPNGYGLYDMAGNVAEWTISPFNNSFYNVSSSLNPALAHQGNTSGSQKITVRGGSWKDVGYLLMNGYRDWEHADSARSYIGFRTVQTIPEGAKINFRNVARK